MDSFRNISPIKNTIPSSRKYEINFLFSEIPVVFIRGTIDFPGQQLIEQDVYNSNEELRNSDVYIRLNKCNTKETFRVQLMDPYSMLVKDESSRYSYISRDQIEFNKDPMMDGMILSVRLNDSIMTKTTMTYLSRGLSWTPRYEVMVIDDQSRNLSFDLFGIHLYSPSSGYSSSIG